MGGDVDWNVPILGGEQMYEAMKSLGAKPNWWCIPANSTDFKTPSHIKDRLERRAQPQWVRALREERWQPGEASGEGKLVFSRRQYC
jgi:hypothetical protein